MLKKDRNNNGNIHPKRIFQTPEDLEKAWNEYKAFRKNDAINWPKVQYVGKDGTRKEDYPTLPLTYEGFKVFCYKPYGDVKGYFDNEKGYHDDFSDICRQIKLEIRDHQITGGMLNQFNSSITQRLNSLEEKTEVRTNIQIEGISQEDLDEGLKG